MSNEIGFVYILSNNSTPGLLKIGYTTRSVESRAAELYTTGVAEKFKIEYKSRVINPEFWESEIHKALASHRVNKEWFRLSIEEAITLIKNVIGSESEKNVKIYESNEAIKLLTMAAESGYAEFISDLIFSRQRFLDMLLILVDLFYATASEDIIKRSKLLDIFKSNQDQYKVLNELKLASIKAVLKVTYAPIPSKSEFLKSLIDSHGNSIKRARELAIRFTSSTRITNKYVENSFYQQNSDILYDRRSNSVRSSLGRKNLGEMLFETNANDNSRQINVNSITDPVVGFLVTAINNHENYPWYYSSSLLAGKIKSLK